ncbi:MAG: FecR domain-containing protein [Verrucomicrobia bacterium]|nr:FecR domain-containing protein [Verrucomicrobiota bacterium]
MKLKLIPIAVLMVALVAVASAETIKVSVVASGGSVTITGPDGASISAKKGANVPIGSKIRTQANSWVDLLQGGVSTIRVKAKTDSFTVTESSFDGTKPTSIFKLKNGAVYVKVNKGNLKGGKYQIQMPELIAGVLGSEGEASHGPRGATVSCVAGDFNVAPPGGTPVAVPAGNTAAQPAGASSAPPVASTPPALAAALNTTAATVPAATGTATDGAASGGTAAGAVPAPAAMAPAATPGTITVSADVAAATTTAGPATGPTTAADPAPPSTPTSGGGEKSSGSTQTSSPSSP